MVNEGYSLLQAPTLAIDLDACALATLPDYQERPQEGTARAASYLFCRKERWEAAAAASALTTWIYLYTLVVKKRKPPEPYLHGGLLRSTPPAQSARGNIEASVRWPSFGMNPGENQIERHEPRRGIPGSPGGPGQ